MHTHHSRISHMTFSSFSHELNMFVLVNEILSGIKLSFLNFTDVMFLQDWNMHSRVFALEISKTGTLSNEKHLWKVEINSLMFLVEFSKCTNLRLLHPKNNSLNDG